MYLINFKVDENGRVSHAGEFLHTTPGVFPNYFKHPLIPLSVSITVQSILE